MIRQSGFVLPIFLILLVAGFVVGIGYLSYRDAIKWDRFSETHDCKQIGHEESKVSVGFAATSKGTVGPVMVASGPKKGFKCNDGITYWRN